MPFNLVRLIQREETYFVDSVTRLPRELQIANLNLLLVHRSVTLESIVVHLDTYIYYSISNSWNPFLGKV